MDQKIFKLWSMLVLVFLFVGGLWAIDIGASFMNARDPVVKGLIFERTPSDHYHIGLLISELSFFILSMFYVHELLKGGVKNGNIQEEKTKDRNDNNASRITSYSTSC